jgi:hypothetical protein
MDLRLLLHPKSLDCPKDPGGKSDAPPVTAAERWQKHSRVEPHNLQNRRQHVNQPI